MGARRKFRRGASPKQPPIKTKIAPPPIKTNKRTPIKTKKDPPHGGKVAKRPPHGDKCPSHSDKCPP